MEKTNSPKKEKKEKRPPLPLKKKIQIYGLYAISAVLGIVGIAIIYRQNVIAQPKISPPPSFSPTATPVPTPTPDSAATPTQTPEPTPYVQLKPTRIHFTKPGYWSDVYPVGSTEENGVRQMETLDSANDAAWDYESAAPREQGNCIMNGHVSFDQQKGVFSYLREMELFEEVVVELENGDFVYYEVVDIFEYDKNEVPEYHLVYGGIDRLTLITCKGDFVGGTSQSRVVVVCVEKSE
ncbi:class F sortase [Eubacteriales bacterium OttesenSCG-928-K08]|nr:class F sortase [Eubacteriales bacterium OttesenSCG-928-K08]